MTSYDFVAGLELHVQLNTETKAFCRDENAFGGEPNSKVSEVSLAHPGALPTANISQIRSAIKLGLALGCEIETKVLFDRKNYFYPDLPKGYQLTQDSRPICKGGSIYLPDSKRKINLHHIHMEEDAGKSIHDVDPSRSLIDLNRAGVPLLEVVTEPDFRSPAEVSEFIERMQKLVAFLEISDGNMEEGSIRCDCNVSIKPEGTAEYGERCEIKNINSKRFARIAVEYEYKRQIELVESGQSISQQTLHFDKERKITYPMRTKENAHDYRYFPDPDLPLFRIHPEMIEEIATDIHQLPWEVEKKLVDTFRLSNKEAMVIAFDEILTEYFFSLSERLTPDSYKTFFDVFFQKVVKLDHPNKLDQKLLLEFVELVKRNKVNKFHAYDVLFPKMISSKNRSVAQIAEELEILQTSDSGIITQTVIAVLRSNPKEVNRYRSGQKKLIGFFLGQVVKSSGGKVPAKEAQKVLLDILESDQQFN